MAHEPKSFIRVAGSGSKGGDAFGEGRLQEPVVDEAEVEGDASLGCIVEAGLAGVDLTVVGEEEDEAAEPPVEFGGEDAGERLGVGGVPCLA